MTVDAVPTEVRGSEIGSTFDSERLFALWEDGKVFDPGPVEVRDLEQMLRVDGKARAVEQVLTLPLRQAPWRIESADGDRGETAYVTEQLTRSVEDGGMPTPWPVILGQMTGATLFRRAFFEKVFVIRDGRVAYDKIAWRPPSTCYLAQDDDTGTFAGFKQRTWRGQNFIDVNIPAQRAFVFIHGRHREPLAGTTDLDVAYTAWMTKQKLRFLWAQFLENLAQPRAVATTEDQDPARPAQLAKTVAKLKGGGVVGLKNGETVTPFETSQGAAGSFEAAIRYLDGEISGSVLAGFTDLATAGASGRGSFALSKDQSDFFIMTREAVLREMEAAVNSQVIPDLVRWNFTNPAMPKLKLGPITEQDATQAVTLLQALATSPSMTALPWEFIDQLTLMVATYLDLDVEKIRAAVTQRAEQGAFPQPSSAPLHAAVDTATRMLLHASGSTTGGQPTPQQLALPGT
jgi:hypothetical protein